MKKIKLVLLVAVIAILGVSCATVDAGHRGVKVSWGGETDLSKVYPEGMDGGISWLWDDMVEYDIRQQTMVKKFTFNDKNDMVTPVEFALDYNLDPDRVNLLHANIENIDIKIEKTLKSAAKEVVPQYSAVELNKTKRAEAEQKLSEILERELPDFYAEFARIQMTDVDIPKKVAELAEQTAVQLGRNELAKKKEAEKVALAKAQVAEAQGNFKAAEYEAKTRDILSQPKMLELQRVENEKIWAQGYKKHGKSPFGTNNWFGEMPKGMFLNISK
jgi:regulator of protease activity HflC (stomatin/prohibitin superfamily)